MPLAVSSRMTAVSCASRFVSFAVQPLGTVSRYSQAFRGVRCPISWSYTGDPFVCCFIPLSASCSCVALAGFICFRFQKRPRLLPSRRVCALSSRRPCPLWGSFHKRWATQMTPPPCLRCHVSHQSLSAHLPLCHQSEDSVGDGEFIISGKLCVRFLS